MIARIACSSLAALFLVAASFWSLATVLAPRDLPIHARTFPLAYGVRYLTPALPARAESRGAVDPSHSIAVVCTGSGCPFGPPAAGFSDMVSFVLVDPEYPVEAKRRGIEGWVDIEFTISPTGIVKDTAVTASSPSAIFDEAALRAARRWKANPKVVGGVPVPRPGIQVRIIFGLPRDPIVGADPEHPYEPKQRRVKGFVDVVFTVTPEGAVEDARAIDSYPSVIYNEAALEAVRRWKFDAKIEDHVGVARPGVWARIYFKLTLGSWPSRTSGCDSRNPGAAAY